MRVGTRSVLYGAHAFWLHPWFVALAWWRLFGLPWDPRLWVAFFVHDLGYVGKPNMDGPEGERHPEWGAWVMGALFGRRWHDLALYHSRFYAKADGAQPSRLCIADKLAIVLTPSWLYVPMARSTGEIHEYMRDYEGMNPGAGPFDNMREWHRNVRAYVAGWVEAHKDGSEDTWTTRYRDADGTGVWS